MAQNASDRPGRLVESHKGSVPRVVFFYFLVVALFVILVAGLAYQQLVKSAIYAAREKQQNQRRIIIPGPRGNIYDREGRLLVGNRARFAVSLSLDELGSEFRAEFIRVRRNYRELGDKDIPDVAQLEQIARYSVVQRRLDEINQALHRDEKVDGEKLRRHFRQNLLLPFVLLNDLSAQEFAELLEQLPATSPLVVYASSTRYYPYGSAAAHSLGYVVSTDDLDTENLPGGELRTFKVQGTTGASGIEAKLDPQLQGEAGGAIYRVSPAGHRIEPALEKQVPVQGKDIVTSLDIDLQQSAETAIGDQFGAAVAMDVKTGEVLTIASRPDYNLNDFSPRISRATMEDVNTRKAWTNLAAQGLYAPGSTFKILVSIAGLRGGVLNGTDAANCEGSMMISGRRFHCENGTVQHHHIEFRDAIAQSCDVFFWTFGQKIGQEAITAEARRFLLDRPTGIELSETKNMIVPTPEWKKSRVHENWFPGDTANISIGQGDLRVSPVQMACFVASVARDETVTKPTLLHSGRATRQHTAPIGLSPEQRLALVDGMEECIRSGTGKMLSTKEYKIPGLRIAGKTGTAQVTGKLNIAWFICFAPVENPEIAIAVAIQGDTPDENFGGGLHAVPVAAAILKTWSDKKNNIISYRPLPKAGAQ